MEEKVITILMADDDADDQLLTKEAWRENLLEHDLRFVDNGEELLQYLRREGKYANPKEAPVPDLILLDINMPRKDGFETAREIKSDKNLKTIPIVVLTTSKSEKDVQDMYALGVNSYITKPVSFDELVKIVKVLGEYWFTANTLPYHKVNTV